MFINQKQVDDVWTVFYETSALFFITSRIIGKLYAIYWRTITPTPLRMIYFIIFISMFTNFIWSPFYTEFEYNSFFFITYIFFSTVFSYICVLNSKIHKHIFPFFMFEQGSRAEDKLWLAKNCPQRKILPGPHFFLTFCVLNPQWTHKNIAPILTHHAWFHESVYLRTPCLKYLSESSQTLETFKAGNICRSWDW